jgi:hypothetical protein
MSELVAEAIPQRRKYRTLCPKCKTSRLSSALSIHEGACSTCRNLADLEIWIQQMGYVKHDSAKPWWEQSSELEGGCPL